MSDISQVWKPIPQGMAICPMCKGTTIGKPYSETELKYTWNKGKTNHPCYNCGAQTMSCTPMGYTKIDPNTGKGCTHHFVHKLAGRCYHEYTCDICLYQYHIDSGD